MEFCIEETYSAPPCLPLGSSWGCFWLQMGCLELPWYVSCVFHKVLQEELSSQYFFLGRVWLVPTHSNLPSICETLLCPGSVLDAFISIVSFNLPGTSEGPDIMLVWGVRDKRFQKGNYKGIWWVNGWAVLEARWPELTDCVMSPPGTVLWHPLVVMEKEGLGSHIS